ncbi:MAG: hypothetical protein ACOVSR_08970 [Bacteroidia bacterium]
MELTEIVVFKMIAPFVKLIHSIGGLFGAIIITIVSPENLTQKEKTYRAIAACCAVPCVMALDSYYNLNKWLISTLTIFLGLFMWLLIEIFKKRIKKVVNEYLDKKGL